jgi:hypothetical protein
MNFFRFFPRTNYGFQSATGNATLTITNPTVHVALIEKVNQVVTVFYDYVVQDEDRPDTVALKAYGGTDYTWLVLLVNNIFTLFDWPLTQREMALYLAEKYGSVQTAQSTFLYRTAENFFVDVDTFNAMDVSKRGLPISAYDHEFDLNEAKRRIKVIPQAFVNPLMTELKKVLSA